jgi:8-oxo-dGTP pyrophosphatase MutT (NUDIX family)
MKLSLAGTIITDKEGRILLLHRNTPKRTQWEIPGGKVELDETPKQTAAREASEELGADIMVVRQLGAEDFTEDGFTMSYTWFLGKVNSGTPKNAEPNTCDDLRYWSIDDLATTSEIISPNTKNFIKQIQAGKIKI